MLKEFKQFAMRGNVVDMAVGLVIGAAFGAIVASFVGDVLMPIIGLAVGGADFSNLFVVLKEGAKQGPPYDSLEAAKSSGAVVFAYGVLVNTVINFLIVAFALFMLVKAMNAAKRKEAAAPPEALTTQEKLLTEIRDLIARSAKA